MKAIHILPVMKILSFSLFLLVFLPVGCTVALGPLVECGNGVIEVGEACDGENLGEATCYSLGYFQGTLSCDSRCGFDTRGCTASEAVCGNDVIEPGETCEGSDLGNKTCASFGFDGGTLRCSAACMFDSSGCTGSGQICGNGVVEGVEECDGTDLGAEMCASLGFAGGTLSCSAACTFDTSGCYYHEDTEICDDGIDNDYDGLTDCEDFNDCSAHPNCTGECRFQNFEACDPLAGVYECCPNNDMTSICFATGEFQACLQTCIDFPDCGWSMECLAQIGNLCYFSYCGVGVQSTPLQNPCTLAVGRPGVCRPSWRAMDDAGLCLEAGTAPHGAVCSRNGLGMLHIDTATQCADGFCYPLEGDDLSGTCFRKCNPITTYDSKTDTCPPDSACVNLSTLNFELFDDQGGPNPHYLFREPDLGVCHIWQPGDEIYTCDLLTGHVIRGPNAGGACPDGMTCNYYGLGSLLGFCSEVAALPKALGEECTIAQNAPQDCGEGLQCFVHDPLNTDGSALACLRICAAPANGSLADATANAACADLTDIYGTPYICMTVSRFFTNDGNLPTSGTGLNAQTETRPSPLGFCVPPHH